MGEFLEIGTERAKPRLRLASILVMSK